MIRSARSVSVTRLGQSGFKLDLHGFIVLTDPYLSDSVARIEGPEFARLQPPPIQASSIHDAALVLISHAHRDHCDPDTLLPIAAAATTCRFMGPPEVLRTLRASGLDPQRLIAARAQPQLFGPGVSVTAVPAAHKHIELESDGSWRYVGYVIEHDDRRYYFAGDTCVHDAVLGVLAGVGRIDIAFLPVNECNFYRDRRGIVGNMSVRDAFQMARELDVKAVVPMHYDMFAPNCVYREEIELIYSRMQPGFELVIDPERL
jgi:L-ascorbate metabolism protein UlaG (beta-lactamase superfamily)